MRTMVKKRTLRMILVPLLSWALAVLPAVRSVQAQPVIVTPADARALGLESLRLAVIADGGVPLPANLNTFLKDTPEARQAALQLGKALFWDMQLGSDGIQSCASCHFQAGADNRTKNQLHPASELKVLNQRLDQTRGYHSAPADPDTKFEVAVPAPNYTLNAGDFPFVNLPNQLNIVGDSVKPKTPENSNDISSSQGVFLTTHVSVTPGSAEDVGIPVADPIWSVRGVNVRRVEPRNTPTTINAVFFFANFWDGRANNMFNGVNPFGKQDPGAVIFQRINGGLQAVAVNISNASLASQAVGPPLSPFEMSFGGRTWPEVGRKMLSLAPMAKQQVAPTDSILGPLANPGGKGLRPEVTYRGLIQAAFRNEFWDVEAQAVSFPEMTIKKGRGDIFALKQGKPRIVRAKKKPRLPRGGNDAVLPGDFTQMEANFSFFFGMAVMLYEATLVSDQSPFDVWMEGDGTPVPGFGAQELLGLNVFVDKGKCINCHSGPEFTNATVRNAQGGQNVIEPMPMGDGNPALYDNGFYNIAVTPTTDDLGRGGKDPFGNPLAFSRQFAFQNLGIMSFAFPIIGALQVPGNLTLVGGPGGQFVDPDTGIVVGQDLNANGLLDPGELTLTRVAVDGAFKTPTLRNVDLTGPYMHNGSLATLKQVVRFYDRGGNFCQFNLPDLDPDIVQLNFTEAEENALVAFMVSLTDNRVKIQAAPFDRPELIIPNGHRISQYGVVADPMKPLQALDNFLTQAATGSVGNAAAPLVPFLNLDPQADPNPEPVPSPCFP